MTIRVLDCTLRDGGYCNHWNFGKNNIAKIIKYLLDTKIDIVECGFLTNSVCYNSNCTKFTDINQFKQFLPNDKKGKLFVALMNYGEYDLDNLPNYDGTSIDGIRLAFHKNNYESALRQCNLIKQKGYKVFVQGMVSLSYTDDEFISLIRAVNALSPYAFYIVDSFGQMKKKDLLRLLYLVENNLDNHICIGFHSHNNMQLAYSNAQCIVDFHSHKNIIIDSSVYGMGRGAGNLNTELFVEYLNENLNANYDTRPLLSMIDEILNIFYEENSWGYSLQNYLSAKHNLHPNYASYLDSKKTLTIEDIDKIFSNFVEDKKINYDKNYIEKLYFDYMENNKIDSGSESIFVNSLKNKEILVLGPSKEISKNLNVILKFIKEKNPIVISLNFKHNIINSDYIFVSNKRRFKEISKEDYCKCVCSSNISAKDVYLKLSYKSLTNDSESVTDNSCLMVIKFLINSNIKKVNIVGVDGYSSDFEDNFIDNSMNFYASKNTFITLNKGMNKVLTEYSKKIDIKFLVPPKFLILP